MKNLILMRHATAADKAQGQADIDRELSLFGQRQAGEAGLWLKQLSFPIELILCSPAVRTQMTLDALLEGLENKPPVLMEPDIYHGSEKDLLYLLHGIHEDVDSVLVIGHNPTIAFLATFLAHEQVIFNPATTACLHFHGFNWENMREGSCKLQRLYRDL